MALHNAVYKIGRNYFNQWWAGEPGNAWDHERTGEGGFSRAVKTYGMPFLSIMGEIEAATTLSFFTSPDGVEWFYCGTITSTINPAEPPAPDWQTGLTYPAGSIVTDGGQKYECILTHVANAARRPPNATYWRLWPGQYPRSFHIYPQVGAEYVRMRSSANVVATVSIMAKRGGS